MNLSLKRRVSVCSCWASTRIAMLDSKERFEDSYAITQEFREWITSVGNHPEYLEASVLKFPQDISEETSESDEKLEI